MGPKRHQIITNRHQNRHQSAPESAPHNARLQVSVGGYCGGDIIRASRVLVIEKDEPAAAQTGATLEKAGFEVVTAVGAYDGLRRLLEAYPDLIIMAQELPPVNGENACLRIRQASYILMMVLGPADEAVDSFELGADAYMSRPPSDVELVAKARSLLRRKQKTYDPPGITSLSAMFGEEAR